MPRLRERLGPKGLLFPLPEIVHKRSRMTPTNKQLLVEAMKQNKKPFVSVVMPVYNAGGFLVKAIESILHQTYRSFELIIVDDASTDGSWKVIKKYQRRFPTRIRAIRLTRNVNKGGDACANRGLAIAKGKYIARMDADDIAYPKRLERQVTFLEANPEVFLVGGQANVIDARGKILGEKTEPLTHRQIYDSYFQFHPIIHPTAMFRGSLDGKRFFYQIKYSANNDMYSFFTAANSGHKLANLPEKLLAYRIHKTNYTFQRVKENFLNTLKIRFEMVRKFGYHPSARQWLITLVQSIVVLSLPEKITVWLYMLIRLTR